MTISDSPFVRFSRRARVRSADKVMAGVSSISIGSAAISRDTCTNLSKSRWLMSPRRMRSLETSDFLAEQAGGQLLGAHLQREHPDTALRQCIRVGRAGFGQQRLRGAKGDLGGKRRLSHARPARENHQIRYVQAAHLRVQVTQSGGQAGHVAGALECTLRTLDRLGQRVLEAHEAAGNAAIGGELEQRLLGRLDLLSAIEFRIGTERVVDHRFADVDQLPSQPGVVDRAAVFAGVDDADHGGEQLREIGGAADFLEHAGVFELGLQRDRVGELTRFDAAGDRLIDAAMDRIGEMLGDKKFGDALIGAVVGEQGAEQRLFCLHIGWRQALRQTEQGRIDGVHCPGSIARPESSGELFSLWMAVVRGT